MNKEFNGIKILLKNIKRILKITTSLSILIQIVAALIF